MIDYQYADVYDKWKSTFFTGEQSVTVFYFFPSTVIHDDLNVGMNSL